MVLVGVELPADRASQLEMAYVFAEEFARSGYGAAQILALFKEPFYGGAHRAFLDLGEEKVTAIVRETVGVWGRMRLVDEDSGASRQTGLGREQGPCGSARAPAVCSVQVARGIEASAPGGRAEPRPRERAQAGPPTVGEETPDE